MREHWKKMLPFITAYVEGKEIETLTTYGWEPLRHASFGGSSDEYRIKPVKISIYVNVYEDERVPRSFHPSYEEARLARDTKGYLRTVKLVETE